MVCWLRPDGIHIDLAFRYTLEHIRAPKTPWNTPPTQPQMPSYILKDESGINGHQQIINFEECMRFVFERLKMSGWFSPCGIWSGWSQLTILAQP